MTSRKSIGTKRVSPGTWVQTERSSHEAWAALSMSSPKAAALLHVLCAKMDTGTNALACSQEVLARLLGVSVSTVKRALSILEEGRWIQILSLGKGATKAYVVNSRVAWSKAREGLSLAHFQASVLADLDDQSPIALTSENLRRIPVIIHDGERQLPAGPGEPPPSQPLLEGCEPELPSLREERQESLPLDDDPA